MLRPLWIYTTVSCFKTFSPLPLCECVKILSILKINKKMSECKINELPFLSKIKRVFMDLINRKSVAINKGKNNKFGSQFVNWFHHLHMAQLVMKKRKYEFECVCRNFQSKKASVVF